jgi:hypothetical protein
MKEKCPEKKGTFNHNSGVEQQRTTAQVNWHIGRWSMLPGMKTLFLKWCERVFGKNPLSTFNGQSGQHNFEITATVRLIKFERDIGIAATVITLLTATLTFTFILVIAALRGDE